MLNRVMEKVMIAGAGISGAVTASLLRKGLPEKCHLTIWEKSQGTGGRMNTSRSPENPKCTVDLGAQYISSEPEDYKHHEKFYTELQKNNIFKPLEGVIIGDKPRPERTKHFVCPEGVGSLAKYYLRESGAELKFNHLITHVEEKDGRWAVSSDKGVSDEFDCVVLTMPVPQILALQGSIHNLFDSQHDVKEKLSKVQYSSRFVLGMFYDSAAQIDLPWSAKYFKGDPVVVFVSIDNKKRGSASSPASVLVHASVPFSLQHLEEDKEAVCKEYILPRVRELLPQLPEPAGVKCHKWRYSQVFKGYEGSPGAIVLNNKPLLLCTGDAFTHSNFDGCLDSALKTANIITNKAQL